MLKSLPALARTACVALAVAALLGLSAAAGLPARAEGAPPLGQAGTPPPPLPANQPLQGLIYDGLQAGAGLCAGGYEVKGTGMCTHGPDPAPAGVDISQSMAPLVLPAGVTAGTVHCEGDGASGKRTQVLYARASDRADRFNTYVSSIRIWAAQADQIYRDSAAETGGDRRIRFVHDASCNITVLNVVLSAAGDDNIQNTMSEMQAQGYNRTDRKYMIFMDANVYCGIGTIYGDDRAIASNYNNGGPSYGRTDAGCWAGWTAAHEHMHNLGGVQNSAPYSSGGYHCVDEYDVMCYSDYPNYPPMQFLCPSAHNSLFDCNHDSYYHTGPPAGSYLATHWNAANSHYLIALSTAPLDKHVYLPFIRK
jgi:hypothetical protein